MTIDFYSDTEKGGNMRVKTVITTLILIITGGVFMSLFSGCSANRYTIDYCGQKDLYKRAKSSCRAGQEVTLYYPHIATDTDYCFYLDDERLGVSYEDKKGIVIRFTMPEHDVKLYMTSDNTMTVLSESKLSEFGINDLSELGADVMLINYYETTPAAGQVRELVLKTTQDPEVLRLDYYQRDSADEEYDVKCCTVPADMAEELFIYIWYSGMRSWDDGGVCIDGVLKVCKFYDNGSYTRVSTEAMPAEADAKVIESVGEQLMKCMAAYMDNQ